MSIQGVYSDFRKVGSDFIRKCSDNFGGMNIELQQKTLIKTQLAAIAAGLFAYVIGLTAAFPVFMVAGGISAFAYITSHHCMSIKTDEINTLEPLISEARNEEISL